jgi:hypothetical protein
MTKLRLFAFDACDLDHAHPIQGARLQYARWNALPIHDK